MYTLPDEYPREAFAAFDYLKTKSVLSNDDLKVIALVESIGELFYQLLARGIDNAEARSAHRTQRRRRARPRPPHAESAAPARRRQLRVAGD